MVEIPVSTVPGYSSTAKKTSYEMQRLRVSFSEHDGKSLFLIAVINFGRLLNIILDQLKPQETFYFIQLDLPSFLLFLICSN